jgi:adenylate cyclase
MEKDHLSRKLAVLLHADIVGSTSLVQKNETLAHERIQGTFRRFSEIIKNYGGVALEIRGDALVAEFAKASDAVSASLAFQAANSTLNEQLSDGILPVLRIGIAMGEVVVADNTVTGEGIVLAQRLEQLARPGGACIQGAAYETLPKRLPFVYENLGEQPVKGFEEPVRVYAVSLESGGVIPESQTVAQLETSAPDLPEKPSIAVLPFKNMSGESEQEYFSDGITEDIITELNRFRELRVMSRESTFYYKEQPIKVQDVGRELGVKYIVEGSVRKSGNRVRVTAQMVEAGNGLHIWAERYDRELEDIFAVQDEITQAIVSVLPSRLKHSMREQALKKATESFSAYDFYLQGRWVFEKSAGSDPSAVTMLEKAVEIDPTFALAHALLAQMYGYNVFSLGVWYGDQESKASPHIEMALKYGENDAAIHALVGETYFCLGDFDQADAHMELAMHLNPNDVATIGKYGLHRAYLGYPAEGLQWLEKVRQMDPQYAGFSWEEMAETLYLLCNYEAALEIYKGRHNPPPHTYTHMAACYAQLGHLEEAKKATAHFKSLCSADVNFPRYASNHARICKRQEDADNWTEGYRKAGLLD